MGSGVSARVGAVEGGGAEVTYEAISTALSLLFLLFIAILVCFKKQSELVDAECQLIIAKAERDAAQKLDIARKKLVVELEKELEYRYPIEISLRSEITRLTVRLNESEELRAKEAERYRLDTQQLEAEIEVKSELIAKLREDSLSVSANLADAKRELAQFEDVQVSVVLADLEKW